MIGLSQIQQAVVDMEAAKTKGIQLEQLKVLVTQARGAEREFFLTQDVQHVEQVKKLISQGKRLLTALEKTGNTNTPQQLNTKTDQPPQNTNNQKLNESASNNREETSAALDETAELNNSWLDDDNQGAFEDEEESSEDSETVALSNSWLDDDNQGAFEDEEESSESGETIALSNSWLDDDNQGAFEEDETEKSHQVTVVVLKKEPSQPAVKKEVANISENTDKTMNPTPIAKKQTISIEISKTLDQYLNSFDKVVALDEIKGYSIDQGFQGKFRKSGQEVEKIFYETENLLLLSEFLSVRNLESDYLAGIIKKTAPIRNRVINLQKTIQQTDLAEADKRKLDDLLNIYLSNFDRVVITNLEIEEARKQFNHDVRQIEPKLARMAVVISQEIDSIVQKTKQTQANVAKTLLLFGGGGIVLFCIFGYFMTKAVTRPIRTVIRSFDTIAKGDLLHQVSIKAKDETGDLSNMMNHFIAQLRDSIQNIAENANTINHEAEELETSAGEVSEGMHKLADSATTQSAAVEQTAATVREIQSNIAQIAKSTKEADQLAEESNKAAQKGLQAVHNMQQSMQNIQDTAKQVNNFVISIKEIAEQTNLLSLNAAIEAVKAGDHGKGFSVVADEVGRLAEKSTTAAREIQQLIQKNNIGIREGQSSVELLEKSLTEINEKIAQTVENAREIHTATQEQTAAIQETDITLETLSQGSFEVASIASDIDHTTAQQLRLANATSQYVTKLLKQIQHFRYQA